MPLPSVAGMLVALLLAAAALASGADAATGIPVTGTGHPDLASFDAMMRTFLEEHRVPGSALAVARHGRLVYARGFGFADAARTVPVRSASLFRIASVSKPLTAVAIMQLVEQGAFALDDPALPLLAAALRPAEAGDTRSARITVRQLLQHAGGWDAAGTGYDPMFHPLEIAREENAQPPATVDGIVRSMLRRPLDFAPGERFDYANFGYCLLGRIIEQASRQGYEAYVRRHVLAPLGITAMRLGRTLPEDRAPDEVEYIDSRGRQGGAVVGAPLGRQVPLPYGAFCVEDFDAHGGWLASAEDLARFASAFDDPQRCPLLQPATLRLMWERPAGALGWEREGTPKAAYYACGWSVRPAGGPGRVNAWHNGLIPGTAALMVHRHDGLSWAVLFNTDADGQGRDLPGQIDMPIHRAADAVLHWPSEQR